MITTDKTRRAIEALKHTDRSFFHADLDEYLIECLESLEFPPTASDAHYIKKELAFIITVAKPAIRVSEMEECIDDWCGATSIEINSTTVAESPNGADLIDSSLIEFESKLKDWHVNLSSALILAGMLGFIFWG